MSENKITFPRRNQDWKTVKSETEKVNDLLTSIPTNDIKELNDLIFAGAKSVCEKVSVLLNSTVKSRVVSQTRITDNTDNHYDNKREY